VAYPMNIDIDSSSDDSDFGILELHFYVDVNVFTHTCNYCITPLLCLLHVHVVTVSTCLLM
jgi:hypothetical protein